MENRDVAPLLSLSLFLSLSHRWKRLAPRYGAMPLRFGSCFSTLDETSFFPPLLLAPFFHFSVSLLSLRFLHLSALSFFDDERERAPVSRRDR